MSIRKIGGIVIDADTLDKEDSAAFEATGVAADLMSDHLTPDAHHAVFTNTEHDVVARHPLVNLDSAVCSETEAPGVVGAAGLDLSSGKNIKVISALTANDAWSGLTAIFTAGEVLALGEAVYLKLADSEVYKALATATTTMPGIALATCATTDGNPFEFLLQGFMRHDAWNWTVGGLLYIDRTTAGALTQTAPSTTGDQVQVVGIAITADIIFFCPSLELVEVS